MLWIFDSQLGAGCEISGKRKEVGQWTGKEI
jgi:hypothetical protein